MAKPIWHLRVEMRLWDQVTLFQALKLFITIKLKHDKQISWKDIFSSKCVIHIIIILTKAFPAKYQFGFGKYKPPTKFFGRNCLVWKISTERNIWKILTPPTSKSVQEDFLLTVPTLTVTAKDPLLLLGGSGVALIFG